MFLETIKNKNRFEKMLHLVPFRSVFGTNLSELQVSNGVIRIPPHIQEECELDETYPLSDWEYVQAKRIASFRECEYYAYQLPFVPFVLSNEIQSDYHEAREFIGATMEDINPVFVKTCVCSPKDVLNPPICSRVDDCLELLNHSSRTSSVKGSHVVLKIPRTFIAEYRCFWVRERLAFVVSREEIPKDTILDFFAWYRFSFPRQSCCVELGLSESHGLEIIEMNAFGPDLICDPAPLDFSQDWERIYSSSETLSAPLWFEI